MTIKNLKMKRRMDKRIVKINRERGEEESRVVLLTGNASGGIYRRNIFRADGRVKQL